MTITTITTILLSMLLFLQFPPVSVDFELNAINNNLTHIESAINGITIPDPSVIESFEEYRLMGNRLTEATNSTDYYLIRTHESTATLDLIDNTENLTPEQRAQSAALRQRASAIAGRLGEFNVVITRSIAVLDVLHLIVGEFGTYVNGLRSEVIRAQGMYSDSVSVFNAVPIWNSYTCEMTAWYYLFGGANKLRSMIDNNQAIAALWFQHSSMYNSYRYSGHVWVTDQLIPGDNPLEELSNMVTYSQQDIDRVFGALDADIFKCMGWIAQIPDGNGGVESNGARLDYYNSLGDRVRAKQ